MKGIKLILLIICFVLTNAQQKKDSIIHINSSFLDHNGIIIKQKIADIILNKEQTNLIKEDKVKYINRHFFINEILDKGLVKENSKGIFIIIPSISHSPYYLLLLDNKVKIINLKNLTKTISEVLSYFKKTNFSEELKYKYLIEILKFYKINKEST
ncbi:hypothetical protein ODZ84_16225 [Chryseobacterium fluminis]|uniref:hypothetical protein n=1 Tax=Chryseobacterium fluminis TaxID=2983606 RepID=UPI002256672F|nr:hypothetical protein [Chryseobacterium sp. MMS21-Ot14]UZT96756.1 hypothetical protein ODZ84_16225 [Chryseobacterium sp. MMS21-Ot14]